MEEYFKGIVEKDFFNLMCGEQLGEGRHRNVYVFDPDPRWVVKLELGDGCFSNMMEWEIWKDSEFMDGRKWLAPCKMISPCGVVLIQRRTRPTKKYPDKVPYWMTDLKRSNFGRIGKQFVAHDYGTNLLTNAVASKRLRNADWWD